MKCLCIWTIFLSLTCTAAAEATSCDAVGSEEPASSCKRKGASGSGIALLAVNWHRSQRVPDAGDGHLGDDMPALVEEPTVARHAAKPFDLFQEDMSSKKVPVLHEGISAKNIPLPQEASLSKGIPISEISSASAASQLSANASGLNDSASYSFSSAGHGEGLASSIPLGSNDVKPGSVMDRAVQEYGMSNETANLPPRKEEQFEPFGYPGAGLLLELHMPEVTLRQLHSSSRGSLAQFLLEVRGELCKSAKVEEPRVAILGIHGRYKRYESDGLFRTHSERSSQGASQGHPSHADEEVVVRFEVLPGWNSERDPREALNLLREELSSPDSGIMRGTLSAILTNSTVTLSAPTGISSQPRMIEHHGMAHMSAMAWPIGISAAFIGILIWLAAY